MGLSVAGEEWAVRAISPCDERFEEGRQIPDMATNESAVITSRMITVVTGPSGTGELWNFLAVAVPVPEIAFIYKKWQPTDVTDLNTLPWTVVTYRSIAAGVSFLPEDLVADTKFSYVHPTIGPGTLIANAQQFRQSSKGLTFNLNASALNNQGMVLVAQYGSEPVLVPDSVFSHKTLNTNFGNPPATVTVPQENMGPMMLVESVPDTTEAIFQKDPHAVRQPARQGAYLPLKFNDPVSLFKPVQVAEMRADTESTVSALPTKANVPLAVESGTSTKVVQWLTTGATPSAGDGLQVYTTSGVTNMQVGVVYFEGISLSASLDIKTVAALEVVATGESAWSGFMKDSPEEDEVVQKQVHAVQRRLPSGHPASFNWLGTLLTSVLPYLGNLAVDLVGQLYKKYTNKLATAASY